jgi:hypothetical protein
LSSVIQNGPSGQRRQDSPAQEWICQNGTIGRNHRVVDDEVIYSVNIATSKVLQINLEISVYKGKLYIFLKKSSWAEEEGGGHLETLSRQRFTRPLPRRPRGSTSICPVGSPKGIKKKSVHNEFYYFIFCVIMLHFFIK